MEHTGCSHRYHLAGSAFDNFCRLLLLIRDYKLYGRRVKNGHLKAWESHVQPTLLQEDAEISVDFWASKGESEASPRK